MTVLVSGGAGYIGAHTVRQLVEAGEDVVVVDNLSTGHRRFLPGGVELIEVDLRDAARLETSLAGRSIESVLHFAASISIPDSVVDPLGYYGNNVGATINLLAAAGKAGARRVIFSSTAAVYGEPASSPVREDFPLVPISPYGASKAMAERVLDDAAATHGISAISLRYFNVAGVDPASGVGPTARDTSHLIRVACQTALGLRETMSIFGTDYDTADGTCVRDFIHVADLAAAHISALRRVRQAKVHTALNCGYGHGFSVREVIASVERVSGAAITALPAARRPGDAAEVVSDPHRLRATLDWTPHYDDLDRIIADALAWERGLAGI